MASCAHLDATPMTPVPSDFEAPVVTVSRSAGAGSISVAALPVATSVAVTPRRRVMPARTHRQRPPGRYVGRAWRVLALVLRRQGGHMTAVVAEARSERAARPVLLTVDDDPSVSRAVARDLRRRYGADYRIMRAESGEEALQAIREVVLRGDQVAAILADYRMPRMNGVDFLEQAMDLVPQARRALVTAYADTNAAIQAINVVDVDHYLLKPWEPPEEKFYPVVDELLEAWQREGKEPEHKIKILGHPWSAASYEVRDFLARNMVPYRWYNIVTPRVRGCSRPSALRRAKRQ